SEVSMMTSLALVLAIALGQTAAPAQPTAGHISGQITIAGTNAPLGGARVMLMPDARLMRPMQPMQPMMGPPPQAMTDENGRFAFQGMKPGSYRVDVQKTGYASMDEPSRGRAVQLADDQSIDNLALQLQKGTM